MSMSTVVKQQKTTRECVYIVYRYIRLPCIVVWLLSALTTSSLLHPSYPIMPELTPDILRAIVDHAVGDLTTKNAKEKARQQEQLYNLMQVSQVSEFLSIINSLTTLSVVDMESDAT